MLQWLYQCHLLFVSPSCLHFCMHHAPRYYVEYTVDASAYYISYVLSPCHMPEWECLQHTVMPVTCLIMTRVTACHRLIFLLSHIPERQSLTRRERERGESRVMANTTQPSQIIIEAQPSLYKNVIKMAELPKDGGTPRI